MLSLLFPSTHASTPTFRTVLPVPASPSTGLRHTDGLVLLSSCFADEVGGRLTEAGHTTCINPLGTIFNPASLSATIARLTSESSTECFISADELRFDERRQVYYSFEAGTAHADEDCAACAASINAALRAGRESLRTCAALFLTLGSAWAYVHADGPDAASGTVVNCHRQPQAQFERRLLTVDETQRRVIEAIKAARAFNPSLKKVVLTVSPVRHTREGLVESSRSKAHLLAACHAACEQQPAQVTYFPSFEILMDELRDYRWYDGEDLIHPSKPAVDYITTRLLETHFTRDDDALRSKVIALRAAARHRHARPESAAARAFAATQLERCRELEAAHPHLAARRTLHHEMGHFEAMASS